MRHVEMTCKNHPTLFWSCKSIAVTEHGRFNGARNIFYNGEHDGEGDYTYVPECSCPGVDLIWTEDGRKAWRADRAADLRFERARRRTIPSTF